MRTSDWSSDVCSSDLAEGDLFLDLCLIQWAYDLGMRVVALERLEEQLALFEAAPAKDQAEVLHELLDRLEEDPNPIERLVEDYLAGDMTRVFREIEGRSEGHTSELQSLMRNSYAVFSLKQKNTTHNKTDN